MSIYVPSPQTCASLCHERRKERLFTQHGCVTGRGSSVGCICTRILDFLRLIDHLQSQPFLFQILFSFIVWTWIFTFWKKKFLNRHQIISHTNWNTEKCSTLQLHLCGTFLTRDFACFSTCFSSYSIMEISENGSQGFYTRPSPFAVKENDTQGGKVTVQILMVQHSLWPIWLKDLVLSRQWLRSLLWLGFNPWPGNFPVPWAQPKKNKQKQKQNSWL